MARPETEDDGIDREAPTPRTTGSFAVFHDQAMELAQSFFDLARIREKVLVAYDRKAAKEARETGFELVSMAQRFAMWPALNPETVALERKTMTDRLFELTRLYGETMASLPRG